MPEGHTIHRLARRQRADRQGRVLTASSPQGAGAAPVPAAVAAAGAAQALDGRRREGVDAYGKHLLDRHRPGG